jgi:hypothetical protein
LISNFRPEKCDFDQFKGFFIEKVVRIRQISKRNKIQIARFLQQVPVGSEEYRRILIFFLLTYLACSQNWLNYFLDGLVVTLATPQNPFKKTPGR